MYHLLKLKGTNIKKQGFFGYVLSCFLKIRILKETRAAFLESGSRSGIHLKNEADPQHC
jgi:hypothetical protein